MNLIWFRNDLRIDDNPALSRAASCIDSPVAGVYLYCPEQIQQYGIGANHHALILSQLEQLQHKLDRLNIPLIIVNCGLFSRAAQLLKIVCRELKVASVYFNVEYPLDERNRDKMVVEKLSPEVKCHRLVADSLVPPWLTINGQKQGYKVFSAFEKAHQKVLLDLPVVLTEDVAKRPNSNREKLSNWSANQSELSDKILHSLPKVNPNVIDLPDVSERKVQERLTEFCTDKVLNYSNDRDYPSIKGTSEISSALAVGTISVSQCYSIANSIKGKEAKSWTRQLVWRDFYRSVMWHFPHTCMGQAFNPVDKMINWSNNPEAIQRVKSAKTGIPIIDAAINQLLKTGWMHNRLRMVVASYLTKNLWLDWRIGEAFFAEHLFDYDFANNNGGWQWSASVGTDAAPYFRVFNPQSQQQKFDQNTQFIRQWLPSLQREEIKKIHRFEQSQFDDYPSPQVDLKATRKLAIESFKNAKALGVA